jgi:hypothetical protein
VELVSVAVEFPLEGLQAPGELEVVELLLGLRIHLEELRRDHGRRVVGGDEPPHVPAADHVVLDQADVPGLDPIRQHRGGNHVVGDHSLLGDLEVARVRGPERRDGAPVDARQEEDGVGQLLEPREERLTPDVALLRAEHDDHAIGAEEAVLVLEEGLDVLVLAGELLREARVHAQLRGEVAHREREERQRREDGAAVPEYEVLEGRDHERWSEGARLVALLSACPCGARRRG